MLQDSDDLKFDDLLASSGGALGMKLVAASCAADSPRTDRK